MFHCHNLRHEDTESERPQYIFYCHNLVTRTRTENNDLQLFNLISNSVISCGLDTDDTVSCFLCMQQ
jgi:hypothetical protein